MVRRALRVAAGKATPACRRPVHGIASDERVLHFQYCNAETMRAGWHFSAILLPKPRSVVSPTPFDHHRSTPMRYFMSSRL